MTIAIDQQTVRATVPRHLRQLLPDLTRLAREDFASECLRLLPSALGDTSRVIRLKQLRFQVRLQKSNLEQHALGSIWAETFVREFQKVLNSSTGYELVRAETEQEWLARVITDLLAGTAPQKWEYQEFANLFSLNTADAILELLCSHPESIVEILRLLNESHTLTRVLSLFDEIKLETLFSIIARRIGVMEHPLTIDHLIMVAKTLRDEHLTLAGGQRAQRIQALQLYLQLANQTQDDSFTTWSPRVVLHAIRALLFMMSRIHTGLPTEWTFALRRLLQDPTTQQSLGAAVFRTLQDLSSTVSPTLMTLLNVLVDLRVESLESSTFAATRAIQHIESPYAGLFLLIGRLIRLQWPQLILGTALGKTLGSQAITNLLASMGQAIVGERLDAPSRMDAGLALFAGWTDTPDISDFHHMLSLNDPSLRRDLLSSLAGPHEGVTEFAETWATTMDYLASKLIREFAAGVRGFRQASRAFVVQRILATPGFVEVYEHELIVTLNENPFHVALHVSGADDTVEKVGWLGHRDVTFILQGM